MAIVNDHTLHLYFVQARYTSMKEIRGAIVPLPYKIWLSYHLQGIAPMNVSTSSMLVLRREHSYFTPFHNIHIVHP